MMGWLIIALYVLGFASMARQRLQAKYPESWANEIKTAGDVWAYLSHRKHSDDTPVALACFLWPFICLLNTPLYLVLWATRRERTTAQALNKLNGGQQ